MLIKRLDIPDLIILAPKKIQDRRGFFSETYNKRWLEEAGFTKEFVQDNYVLSVDSGVVRGLHFQISPFAQDKLVRVLKGSILDVTVDIRSGSPTFGKHAAVELSESNWLQLLVPAGFAHGYCTLSTNTEVAYKVTNFYSTEHERGILWSDPALQISWPVSAGEAIVLDRDLTLPLLSDCPAYF